VIEVNWERAVYALIVFNDTAWAEIYTVYRTAATFGKDCVDLCGIEIIVEMDKTSTEGS